MVQECPEVNPEDCSGCSKWEIFKVKITCAGCYTSYMAFAAAVWAAWQMPAATPPQAAAKVAAALAAVALYFTTLSTCIKCGEVWA